MRAEERRAKHHAVGLTVNTQSTCRFGATYRLQFNAGFQFDDAAKLVPYLADLGVTQVYASPLFRAGAQSTHGYDVCSFEEIDPKLGGGEEFVRFSDALGNAGLGLLLDIVPNHMLADTANPWWLDVLEKGPYSRYANTFDIDWDSSRPPAACRKVLLPILEEHYAAILESGQLKVVLDGGAFWIAYGARRFPAALPGYAEILEQMLPDLAAHSLDGRTVQELIDQCRTANASELIEQAKARLRELERSDTFNSALSQTLERFNGTPGAPESFDRLDRMLQAQNYRLCWWRIAPEQIDYRRFFDINELVCLNAQRSEVFEAVHRLPQRLIHEGRVCGLRVDHLDGLWDPQQYLCRLQGLWPEGTPAASRYVIAEKILGEGETLPREWAIHGTTGYDFLNEVNGIFVHRAHKEALNHLYKTSTGANTHFRRLLFACRLKLLRQSFPGQFAALADRFAGVAAMTRYGRDFPVESIRFVLAYFLSVFPVYRNYVTKNTRALSDQEARNVEHALKECRRRTPSVDPRLLDFLRQILLLQFPADFDESAKAEARVFIGKLQQLTAPLAAKGLEDTAFYRYNRLVSLNEVGGNPGEFGLSVRRFHRANQCRARTWPRTLIATATHDTKHGEDTRARINVLSEMPETWAARVRQWSELNQGAKSVIGDEPAPSPNDEYLLYQSLIGAWPAEPEDNPAVFRGRIEAFMLKAVREAKKQTSWTDPNPAYEEALRRFIARLVAPGRENLFLPDFLEFQRQVAFFGYLNSLSQLLLKSASPGVPDFYQGSELWDLSLVDPDNRRPVAYAHRIALLRHLQDRWIKLPRPRLLGELLETMPTGAIKLFVTWRMLRVRRDRPELFAEGRYHPATPYDGAAQHLCAFVRERNGDQLVVAAPRLVCSKTRGREIFPVGDFWGETWLSWPGAKPGQEFRELFSDRQITVERFGRRAGLPASAVFAEFPLAVLALEAS